MAIVVLQLQRINTGLVVYNEPLIFDTVDMTNNTIDYESTTGVITFNNIGIYTLRWFIAPVAVDTPTNINFVVEATGVIQILEVSPVKHSKLHGHCTVKVVTEKTTIRLINISNVNGNQVDIKLNGNLPVQANLIVIDNLGLWNVESEKLPPGHPIGEPPAPPVGEINNAVPPAPLDPQSIVANFKEPLPPGQIAVSIGTTSSTTN